MRRSCLFAAALLIVASAVHADTYQWTDAKGKVHFTDDPTQVPEDKRANSRRKPAAASGGRNYNILELERPSSGRWTRAPTSNGRAAKTGKTHVLGVQGGGSEVAQKVSVDGEGGGTFNEDTGASMNTIPRWVADRLGLEINSDTPHMSVVGVGGRPIRAPIVRIESIRVGGAEVQNVDVVVLDTLNEGLLGLPFFNHFKVELDPTVGTMKLTEIDRRASGLDEATWRERYKKIRKRLDAVAEARDQVPSEYETVAETYQKRLDEHEAALEEQLERLDEDATRAGVPGNWRE